MDHAVHAIVSFVAAHASLAYATVFMAAFLEAVPVVGSFIPGSTVILSLSALIPSGNLSLGAMLAAAYAGAVLGDGSAYGLGHRYPGRILTLWPLNKYPAVVERSSAFFRHYGNTAVFLARFLPPVRAFVPITAGALGMPPRRFFPINIAAIACWAPAHVVPGILAGTAYGHAGALGEHLTIPVVAGVVAVGVVIWAIRRWLPAEI
jgi:membrane protein DedA with SNARE-associated domain